MALLEIQIVTRFFTFKLLIFDILCDYKIKENKYLLLLQVFKATHVYGLLRIESNI